VRLRRQRAARRGTASITLSPRGSWRHVGLNSSKEGAMAHRTSAGGFLLSPYQDVGASSMPTSYRAPRLATRPPGS
jgi:hypothetical protein